MGYASFLYRQVFVHPPPLPHTLSLAGQTILITGSNSGIGLEAARQCAFYNASMVILAVRSIAKGDAARKDILAKCPESKTRIEVWELDMNSFASVEAIGQLAKSLPRLDVVMLNAGIFKFDWGISQDGFEEDLQVNHLSTALLSLYLLPVLRQSAAKHGTVGRLTFTSSEVHMWTPFKEQTAKNGVLAELNRKEGFGDHMDRYSVTKLLNVFWIRELVERITMKDGTERQVQGNVVVNMVNPGSVDTGLHRDGNKIIQTFDRVVGRTREEGGRLLMDAAVVKGSETHGKYLSETKLVDVSSYVRSDKGQKMQKQLWDETMVVLKPHVAADGLDGLM